MKLPQVDATMLDIEASKDWSRRMEALLTVVNWTGPLSKEQVAGVKREKAPKYEIGSESE